MPGLVLPAGLVPSLVALDLDGTLLAHDGTVSRRAAEALVRVRKLGVVVVAATGRSLEQTIPVCRQVGID